MLSLSPGESAPGGSLRTANRQGGRVVASFDWQGLMDRWNQDLLSCPSIVATLSPAIVASGWLGYAPATAEDIWRAERRLKVSLPPSYRQFLETTNGWRTLGRWVGRLWSADE